VLTSAGKTIDGNFLPNDEASYAANSSFGQGENIGPNFMVYSGTVSSLTLMNLHPETTYHFALVAFNGNDTCSNYLTSLGPRVTGCAIPDQCHLWRS